MDLPGHGTLSSSFIGIRLLLEPTRRCWTTCCTRQRRVTVHGATRPDTVGHSLPSDLQSSYALTGRLALLEGAVTTPPAEVAELP
jgi:hypothetical protein